MENSPVKITLEYVAKCDRCSTLHAYKFFETTSEDLSKLYRAYQGYTNLFKKGYVLNKCCVPRFILKQTIIAIIDVTPIKEYLREASRLSHQKQIKDGYFFNED